MKELSGYVSIIKFRFMESRHTTSWTNHSAWIRRRNEMRERAKAVDYWWNVLRSSVASWNRKEILEAAGELKILKREVLLPDFPHLDSRMNEILDKIVSETS